MKSFRSTLLAVLPAKGRRPEAHKSRRTTAMALVFDCHTFLLSPCVIRHNIGIPFNNAERKYVTDLNFKTSLKTNDVADICNA